MATYTIWANDRGFPIRVAPGNERPRLDGVQMIPGSIGIGGYGAQHAWDPHQPFDPNCTTRLDTFQAEDNIAAVLRFKAFVDNGVEPPRHGRARLGQLWRYRGVPYYLDIQGTRLGLSKVLTDRARHNPEVKRIEVLLAQLSERYHTSPKQECVAVVPAPMLAQIRGTLGQVEEELAKLHALAGSAQSMADETYLAFGLEPPQRDFGVRCCYDEIPTEAELKPSTNGQASPVKAEKKQSSGK